MTMGTREWDEEKVDEFLKDCDPRGEKKFNYMDIVKKFYSKRWNN